VPNKRFGGVTLGGKIAPIFFNTQEDSGSLPIEVDVSRLEMGDVVDVLPYDGKIVKNGSTVAEFKLKSDVLFDEVRAGGRINLIIGRSLTAKAREFLGLGRVDGVPPAAGAGHVDQGLYAGAEDGRPRLRPAGGPGRAPGHVLRAAHDQRRQPGHHRPDDARRAEGPRLPRLQRRSS
jgi:aconitate hydratase 2/2-methylisocitrate dehydratase